MFTEADPSVTSSPSETADFASMSISFGKRDSVTGQTFSTKPIRDCARTPQYINASIQGDRVDEKSLEPQ